MSQKPYHQIPTHTIEYLNREIHKFLMLEMSSGFKSLVAGDFEENWRFCRLEILHDVDSGNICLKLNLGFTFFIFNDMLVFDLLLFCFES